jgi:hypothetical protein
MIKMARCYTKNIECPDIGCSECSEKPNNKMNRLTFRVINEDISSPDRIDVLGQFDTLEEAVNTDTSDSTPTNEESPKEFIQASKRQLYALYLGTKIKTTDLVISKDKAGELISKSIKGINITEELQAFINGETFITEVEQSLPEVEEETVEKQEEEVEATMENFDDILSKFDEVVIENNTRIAQEDQTFCDEQENSYNEFIKFSNDYLEYLNNNSLYNIFYNSDTLINEMNKTREIKKDSFISKLVSYFRNKYKVTLKDEPIQKKYDTNINSNIIIDEIIEQLSGYNFVDKAEKEIKDELKNSLRHDSVKVNNSKVSIDKFFYIDSWDLKYKTYSVNYGSDDKFEKLFKALSHFLYKSNQNNFKELYEIITREKNDAVFKTHEISNDIVKSLKIYKNGKIDIEFNNTEHMRKFAREYCGYTGEQKTA